MIEEVIMVGFVVLVAVIGILFAEPNLNKIKTIVLAPTLCDISYVYLFSVSALLAIKYMGNIGAFALAALLIVSGVILRKYGIRYALIVSGVLLLWFTHCVTTNLYGQLFGLFALVLIVSYVLDTEGKFNVRELIATFINAGTLTVLLGCVGLLWFSFKRCDPCAPASPVLLGALILLPVLCVLFAKSDSLLNRFGLKEFLTILISAAMGGLIPSVVILSFAALSVQLAWPLYWSLVVLFLLYMLAFFAGILMQERSIQFGFMTSGLIPLYHFALTPEIAHSKYLIYLALMFAVLLFVSAYIVNKRLMQSATPKNTLLAAGILCFFTMVVGTTITMASLPFVMLIGHFAGYF